MDNDPAVRLEIFIHSARVENTFRVKGRFKSAVQSKEGFRQGMKYFTAMVTTPKQRGVTTRFGSSLTNRPCIRVRDQPPLGASPVNELFSRQTQMGCVGWYGQAPQGQFTGEEAMLLLAQILPEGCTLRLYITTNKLMRCSQCLGRARQAQVEMHAVITDG